MGKIPSHADGQHSAQTSLQQDVNRKLHTQKKTEKNSFSDFQSVFEQQDPVSHYGERN